MIKKLYRWYIRKMYFRQLDLCFKPWSEVDDGREWDKLDRLHVKCLDLGIVQE